jgi:hypothetical protein
MASITLTRAQRLQDRIRGALRELPLASHVEIGIFAADPSGAVGREAGRLRKNLEVLTRLLAILAEVRAATGRANAECGIGDLLAEKAGIEEEIGLLARLIAVAGDFGGLLGTRPRPPLHREAGEIEAQIRAMRARYEQADQGDVTIDAGLLDDADAERLRERIVACRRRLEEIGDRLRELNGSVRIEIDDAALAWLREHEVI